MNIIEEQATSCPYCGEIISLLVDCSVASQEYIEDCQVCCRPIIVSINIEDELVTVYARQESD